MLDRHKQCELDILQSNFDTMKHNSSPQDRSRERLR